jgi:hypothetical protein
VSVFCWKAFEYLVAAWEDYFVETYFTLWYFKYVHFKNKIQNIKDEQKCINKNKRICSIKFGFTQKAALKDLEGRMWP